jgi:hypothetical protein
MNIFKSLATRLLVLMGATAPSMLTPVGVPQLPVVRPSKVRYYEDEEGNTRIDHRAMERNKYAPWGRGVAGGAAV